MLYILSVYNDGYCQIVLLLECTVNGHVYKHQEAVASHNGCAFK